MQSGSRMLGKTERVLFQLCEKLLSIDLIWWTAIPSELNIAFYWNQFIIFHCAFSLFSFNFPLSPVKSVSPLSLLILVFSHLHIFFNIPPFDPLFPPCFFFLRNTAVFPEEKKWNKPKGPKENQTKTDKETKTPW